jgi:hypothetical protein
MPDADSRGINVAETPSSLENRDMHQTTDGHQKMGKHNSEADLEARIEVNEMTLAEVQAELISYKPSGAWAVVHSEEHRKRRQRLWKRLDQLLGIRRPEISKPTLTA